MPKASNSVLGTILVPVVGAHQLKVEMFPGKSAAQVSGFTGNSDDAKPAS
jgi:hypothetical protein